MSRQDRQRLNIFVVLLAVLGLTLILGYRMNRPATTAAVQSPETKKSARKPPEASDARIRLDIVENSEDGGKIGQKNVFQYGQRQSISAPQASPAGTVASSPADAVPVATPSAPTVPPVPPPPPPIPLKFTGFAVINSSLTAFLSDDSSRHYNVTAGEVLMGRYRIVQISDTTVQVEDLQSDRRQILPLLK